MGWGKGDGVQRSPLSLVGAGQQETGCHSYPPPFSNEGEGWGQKGLVSY